MCSPIKSNPYVDIVISWYHVSLIKPFKSYERFRYLNLFNVISSIPRKLFKCIWHLYAVLIDIGTIAQFSNQAAIGPCPIILKHYQSGFSIEHWLNNFGLTIIENNTNNLRRGIMNMVEAVFNKLLRPC